ncbi:MAG TPA: peptide chain release factor N(5)-glutamine methyltransferase, partial [Synergistaceae bacterium]|nr:peptide chain release factor N(5)-glutamine methyltransferase [Synergistaceae bacterium]
PHLMKEVRFEPSPALDGGYDGLEAYRILIPWAEEVLTPGGILAVEIGDTSQVAPLRFMGEKNLVSLKVRKDYNGLERILLWRKSA